LGAGWSMVDLEYTGYEGEAGFHPRQSVYLSSRTLEYERVRRGLESVNLFELIPEVE